MTTKPEDLQKGIQKELQAFSKESMKALKNAVEQTAKETNKTIKKSVTFKNRTGRYVRAFRVKTIENSLFIHKKVWYVASPEYRKSHLLERPHRTPNGKMTRAFPHLSKGAEFAEKRLQELTEEKLNGIS